MDSPMSSQEAGASDPSEAPEQESFSVTIADNGDGTYTVTSSDSDDSADDGSDGGAGSGSAGSGADSDDQPQTAQSLDDAFSIAKQMFAEESGEDEGDDGSDGNAPLSPADAKSAWAQMASKRKASQAGM